MGARRIIVIGAVVAAATVSTIVGSALVGSPVTENAAAVGTGGCDPALAGSPPAGVSVGSLTSVQLKNAQTIITVGRSKNIPDRGILVAIATAGQESRYRNLANPSVPGSLTYPYDGLGSDHDSLGTFQQRPSQGWGTVAQLMDPIYAVATFYRRLLAVAGWQTMPITVAAQSVQRSAFPDAYAPWASLATQLFSKLGHTAGDVTGCQDLAGQDLTSVRSRIVSVAQAQLGLPYVFNAGDSNGPTKAIGGCDQAAIGGCDAVGFDCSGLTLYAWAQIGIRLDHYAATQYAQGQQVPVAQAQPGDLLFWATDTQNPASIHHVAIYVGNDQMIEAPQSGQVVHQTPVRHDTELMPLAVEPVVVTK